MPETRKVEQHKIYTLYENVEVVRGKSKGKEITRTDRVAVAVFDDPKLLAKFQKALEPNDSVSGYEVVEDWVEYQPEAGRFSLPFNPSANEANDNGAN